MSKKNNIEEIFFNFLLQFKFDEKDLDYTILEKHKIALQALSSVGNSGVSLFDISKRQIIFYSSNYGELLGYVRADYQKTGQQFFADKIHPDDKLKLNLQGISLLKMFNAFSSDEKLNHKVINEYRILNAQNKYVRLIEQHQMIELDKKGQIWLMMSIVDISPNQEKYYGIKCQLSNFRTGQIIPLDTSSKAQFDLTKREIEVLQLVKKGYFSKEISDKLSISLHTVNTHRQRFLEKLGASNSIEAVIFASKFGLLD